MDDIDGYLIGLHKVGTAVIQDEDGFQLLQPCYIALRELGGIVTIGMAGSWEDFTDSWLGSDVPLHLSLIHI